MKTKQKRNDPQRADFGYDAHAKAQLASVIAAWDEILRQSPKKQRAFLLEIGAIKPDGSLNMISTNDHVPLGPVE